MIKIGMRSAWPSTKASRERNGKDCIGSFQISTKQSVSATFVGAAKPQLCESSGCNKKKLRKTWNIKRRNSESSCRLRSSRTGVGA